MTATLEPRREANPAASSARSLRLARHFRSGGGHSHSYRERVRRVAAQSPAHTSSWTAYPRLVSSSRERPRERSGPLAYHPCRRANGTGRAAFSPWGQRMTCPAQSKSKGGEGILKFHFLNIEIDGGGWAKAGRFQQSPASPREATKKESEGSQREGREGKGGGKGSRLYSLYTLRRGIEEAVSTFTGGGGGGGWLR